MTCTNRRRSSFPNKYFADASTNIQVSRPTNGRGAAGNDIQTPSIPESVNAVNGAGTLKYAFGVNIAHMAFIYLYSAIRKSFTVWV